MLGEGVGRLVVMQDGTMRGLITKTGLLRFVEMKRLLAH
jgi:predicted transcriptional regulator